MKLVALEITLQTGIFYLTLPFDLNAGPEDSAVVLLEDSVSSSESSLLIICNL